MSAPGRTPAESVERALLHIHAATAIARQQSPSPAEMHEALERIESLAWFAIRERPSPARAAEEQVLQILRDVATRGIGTDTALSRLRPLLRSEGEREREVSWLERETLKELEQRLRRLARTKRIEEQTRDDVVLARHEFAELMSQRHEAAVTLAIFLERAAALRPAPQEEG